MDLITKTESSMIAFVPTVTDWCKIECPHMTLVFTGDIKDLKPGTFNELAKDAASLAMLATPFYLNVMGVEIFGEEEKVKVLKLMPSPELWAMRRSVESWNASDHPFNPHVTVGPEDTFMEEIPRVIGFDKIMVGWGDEKLMFWLRR